MMILFVVIFLTLTHCTTELRAQNLASPEEPDSKFVVFKKARKCFDLDKAGTGNGPRCEFKIKFLDDVEAAPKINCIKNETVLGDASPVLRVQGDFNIFKIQCSAAYPIDFKYNGVVPNEAIFVNWWKEIDKDSPTIESPLNRFVVEAEVYSVQALYNYYNNPENSLFVDKRDGIPYPHKYDYPRSGSFQFPAIFNATTYPSVAFHLILEDGAKPEFLRNIETVATIEQNFLLLPCISSHWETSVELTGTLPVAGYTFNPVRGFKIPAQPGQQSFEGTYTCVLKNKGLKGETVDTLTLPYDPTQTTYLYGFKEISKDWSEIRIDLNKQNYGAYTSIKSGCKRVFGNDQEYENQVVIAVPMQNFGFMRLRQLFALPEYCNRSYTARSASHPDVLTTKMEISSATTERMLTIFCRYGHSMLIADFGTSVTVHVDVQFGFGRDWATFDRSKSAIATHFVLGLLDNVKQVYTGTEVGFFCKVNIPVVSKPVVWYTIRTDGSRVRELIDYNLTQDVSVLRLNITRDMQNVSCHGSYWYSSWFREISMKLDQNDGVPPKISTTKTEFNFPRNAGIVGSIRCEAEGTPEPVLYFKKDGVVLTQSRRNMLNLELDKIDDSTEGIYVCVATNDLGTAEKQFIVEVYDASDSNAGGGLHIGVVIMIPVIVFIITILGAYIYIRYFKPEKTGLTREEIEEFMNGLKEGEFSSNKGEYAHDFAHLVPYTGDYEISPSHFRVDMTNVLGSGAYGMVLRGSLDDQKVAVKTVKRNADKQYLKALLSELKIMIYLGKHPHLIEILGAYTKELSKGIVYVFVKFIENGSLESYLRANKTLLLGSTEYMNTIANRLDPNSFSTDDLLKWSIQIADGMDYLSSKKVIHGDLATRNVLVDENKNVRITDFGLSRQLYDYSNYVKRNQEPLPWRWMAIESLKFLSFSTASDVWAYGVTIWEIFALAEVPYPGYSWNLEFVEELESGLRMSRPKYASDSIYLLMSQCWHKVPERRPTFEALREGLKEIMAREFPNFQDIDSTLIDTKV